MQPLLQRKSNTYYIFLVCYPACNAHAPYCRLWHVRLYNIFPHYLIKTRVFDRKYFNIKKCVLIFSTTLPEPFLILRRTKRDDEKCILSGPYYCQTNEIWIFSTGFRNTPNIKFQESPSSASRVVPCGQTDGRTDRRTERQTDRHDEANSRFSQLCERALKEASGFLQNRLTRRTTARALQTSEVRKMKMKLHSVLWFSLQLCLRLISAFRRNMLPTYSGRYFKLDIAYSCETLTST